MEKTHPLNNPSSLRFKLRKNRSKHVVSLVKHIVSSEEIKVFRICDLGGTYRYWNVFPFEEFPDTTFEISLVNIMKKSFKQEVQFKNVRFISMIGDGCKMDSTETDHYHICHSNSVIEHVGNWGRIKAFVQESKRIGKYFYVQTPNYWFPVEPHYMLPFVHFLPRPFHTSSLRLFKGLNFDRATENFDENRMLSRNEFKYLFPDSDHFTEWFVLPKSFIATSKI